MCLCSHAAIQPENTNWHYVALHGMINAKNLNKIWYFWNLRGKGFQAVHRLSKSVDMLGEAAICPSLFHEGTTSGFLATLAAVIIAQDLPFPRVFRSSHFYLLLLNQQKMIHSPRGSTGETDTQIGSTTHSALWVGLYTSGTALGPGASSWPLMHHP